ncbi:hypothetical protein [Streptomyces flaveolus]|uniref:hypothetical protein n=1 Tax=Streptomyces flaveolus TaxID=67297 RepID=UPI0034118308
MSLVIRPTGEPMTFTANGLALAPFYINPTERYHMYFKRAEPEIVFGAHGHRRREPPQQRGTDVLLTRGPQAADGVISDL